MREDLGIDAIKLESKVTYYATVGVARSAVEIEYVTNETYYSNTGVAQVWTQKPKFIK